MEPSIPPQLEPSWMTAVRAADAKKAVDILVLDLRDVTSFADYFVICTGLNPRQSQAICDETGLQLSKLGELPVCVEGYQNAEWILADYGYFLLHVFTEKARAYYDLERLWKHARKVPVSAALAPNVDSPAA